MTLKQLYRVVSVFRTHDEIMPSQRLAAFLLIATRGQAKTQQAADALGLSVNATLRNLNTLADVDGSTNGYGEGLGWLSKEPDPDKPRRHLWSLTPQGEERSRRRNRNHGRMRKRKMSDLSWTEWLSMVKESDNTELKALVEEMETTRSLEAKERVRTAWRADVAALPEEDASDHVSGDGEPGEDA